jgi:NtrC-family two-component system response regulator AlgB
MNDIDRLALSQLQFIAGHSGKTVRTFSPGALEAMRHYPWPGNVREMRNVIERAVILSSSETIEAQDLSDHIQPASEIRLGGKFPLEAIEAEHIRRVVANTRTLEEAATILGIDPATLYRKRKKQG